ncbi:MAG: ABC transporter permease [Alphaproteobacteria bacterium]
MGLVLDIALTHLKTRTRQTAVSVLGVAMGVGFSVAMASMMQGFQRDFISRVIDNSPHIIMKDEYRNPPEQPVARVYDGAVELRGLKPEEELRGIKRAHNTISVLSTWPGLSVAPTLEGQVFLRYGSADVSANLIGIDPDRERKVTKIEKDLIAGDLDALKTAPNGIIVGYGLARDLGVAMSDTVTAVSPVGVIMRMKVVGILRTGIIAVDKTQAYTLLKKSQVLQNRTNVINQIRIHLDDVSKARATAALIERRYGYRTESWEEANEGIFGIFVVQNAVMYSTTGAILIVACFGIFNVISTVVFEKSRDIAILKSMGFTELDIRRIFLAEGLAVGAIGSVAGWALAYTLVRILGAVKFHIEGMIEAQGFILYTSVWQYVIASSVAAASATLAAYLPARRAARLNPVEIIRGAA